jgi:Ca-activated chloride channel family protein
MHSPGRSVGSRNTLIATRLFLAGAVLWLVGLNVIAASKGIERIVPATGIDRIIVSNAASIAINAWENDQVKLVAVTPSIDSKDNVRDRDITITSDKGVMEISCSPTKSISLTLNVPSRKILNIKTFDGSIEIKNPVGPIFIDIRMVNSTRISEDRFRVVADQRQVIRLETPPGASIDLSDVQWASFCDYLLPGNPCRSGSHRQIGAGPPYAKLSKTDARVSVFGPPLEALAPLARKLTFAAETIARHNNRMGQAIRKVEPRLSKPDTGQPSKTSTRDHVDDEINLQTQLVNLSISVMDHDSKAIPGLTQNDFRIYEDGVLQPISLFSTERTPFNLILLLDLSGSVEGKEGFIKAAASHFLDVVGPQDNVGLITFTTDVSVVSHLINDKEKLRASIEKISIPIGGTAVYDALGYVLTEEFSKVSGQRNAVVVLSDGMDSAIQTDSELPAKRPAPAGSFLTFEDLVEGAKEAGAIVYPIHLYDDTPMYSIGLFTPPPKNFRATQQTPDPNSSRTATLQALVDLRNEVAKKQMRELAEITGGRFYDASLMTDLKHAYDQIAAELRTTYSVGYKPSDQRFDGKFRRIRIEISKPEAVARTRQGYYAN